MNTSEQPAPVRSAFAPTRWTLVLRARGESSAARAALSELCEAYYAPVMAFIRSGGHDEDSARELTQEFFARLLSGHGLDKIDPRRGRFRSFLLGAVKHFLADHYDRAHAAKRGGSVFVVSVDAGLHADTSAAIQIPDPTSAASDTAFDREWAQTLVARAMTLLAEEAAEGDKAAQFDTLKPWLLGELDCLSQADAARQLNLSEGAVKVAIHRLRKRFRQLVKSEISHTLPEAGQVDEEMRYLVEVLAS